MTTERAIIAILAAFALGLLFTSTSVGGTVLEPIRGVLRSSASPGPDPVNLMNFQGELTDPGTGDPVADGAYSIRFSIWDAESLGNEEWNETNNNVQVSGGLFSVLLGSVTPVTASVFAESPRYLEIEIDPAGAAEVLTPRQQFATVPYAFHAVNAWALDGNSGTTAGTDIMGTTDNEALELHVNGARALRLEPNAASVPPSVPSPNVIGGHSANTVTGGVFGATIGGGGSAAGGYPLTGPNRVTDDGGTVGGGGNNQAGDGDAITTNRAYATVGGGEDNMASGWYSTVGGGVFNTASAKIATVGGGAGNTASGTPSTVGGGKDNTASNSEDTVAGGARNTANGGASTVGGGAANTASGWQSTLAGGGTNTASGDFATVSGGQHNAASGYAATVPGGWENIAAGDNSFAAGRRAKIAAAHDGAFLFADNNSPFDFNSAAANEFAVRSTGGARVVTAIDGSGNPTAGVKLDPGDTAWEVLSDRDTKENYVLLDAREILERLSGVPITEWNYKAQDASNRHIGPTAQDFYAAFGLSDDERYISPIDTDGVALAAIQGLYELAQDQEAQIEALEARLGVSDGASGVDTAPAAASAEIATSPLASSGSSTLWLALGSGLFLAAVVLLTGLMRRKALARTRS